MKLSEAINQRINYYLKLNNMKPYDLYKKTGISRSTISTFMNAPNSLPKIDTILHVCEGFNITLREFFSDPIFDEAEQD